MGSANCKEYVTTSKNDKACDKRENGTTGTYHSTCDSSMADYTDAVAVCKIEDIEENEMRQVEFDDNTKILLVKQNGELLAVGNKCPHYGAPMQTGALGQGRVRCPWHGACFNLKTGDIEDFPGMDSLPCYKVQVEANGQVKVRARRRDLELNKRLKDMVKRKPDDNRCYVVVGGGPAGAVCAETLRQEGFTGRIVMLCRESYLPYDRVKVSKAMDVDIERLQFRDKQFYEEYGIEALLGVEATGLNASEKTLSCSNGQSIKYDKVFLATGCRAAKPPIKGAELKNVLTLRDYADAKEVTNLIKAELQVVCLGSSFIAMEAAAFLTGKVKSITVVAREDVPFKAVFGSQVGGRFLRLYQEKGVDMRMNSGIKEIIGDANGAVNQVQLIDDTKIPCDLLIMGTGSILNTDFLKSSGLKLNNNGSIDTDMHLMSSIPDIFVGGDIANAPILSNANQRDTIGHYQLAQYHGRVAALNMCGNVHDLRAVPFFFTMVFGKGVRYAGYGSKYKNELLDGDLEGFKFIVYYLDEHDNVMAAASVGRDPLVAQFAELQSQGKRLHRKDIEDKANATEWITKLLEK